MKLASAERIALRERESFRLLRLRKRIHQLLRYRPGADKKVLLIVGCQRSGTSMLHHLFRLDFRTVTYDEISPLSSRDLKQGLRWNPPGEVRARVLRDRAPLVVAKPLVESQDLVPWLDLLPEARAIWMYRGFEDVASSNLKFFGEDNGRNDLVPILAEDPGDWRSQHLDPQVRRTVRRLHEAGGPPHDAAALFWYARNSLFFSRGYDRDPRIIPCRYEDLVGDPRRIMLEAYSFVGLAYPGDRIVRDVFTGSRGLGRGIELSTPVRELCAGLQARLDGAPRLGG